MICCLNPCDHAFEPVDCPSSSALDWVEKTAGKDERNRLIWKKEISNTRKLRKNSELRVRIELTTLRVLVRTLYSLSYSQTPPYGHVVDASPRHYGHFFWSPGKNRHTFYGKKPSYNIARVLVLYKSY